ncbi:cbb3-type cytochrome c oxidase subunit I [Haloarcula nitratireducens]|uniref:Cbb3-type cytochrome c oxidase subunit I n=1 Tax=Haloarcula nitratireducens TaxID=2487749 RepID=A0AAW4PGM7_9EURY|nr:cbb3-type cytochrome c oxidase subunit I [Halomicroarcula nitratireducens]MBX0296748.1 cbb3-type cytochrome c oxidase subunit I [Halomicroarcula nitratireducens]
MVGFEVSAVAILVAVVVCGLLYWQAGLWPTKRFRADGGTVGETRAEFPDPTELLQWLVTVDHRRIGILYLAFGTVAGLWGATDAMMIRTELLTPESTVWTANTYNALFTTHGLTMLLLFVTPIFTGIGNYFVPLLIGADDMAFPRLNAIAFWLLPPSLVFVRIGLITETVGRLLEAVGLRVAFLFALEPPKLGWTLYPPLSAQTVNPETDVLLLGLHLSGIATTVAAINFIVTILLERGEDVSIADIDIFSWGILTMSGLILFAFPVLGSALIMLLLDRNLGTTFFVVDGGGPILWQHLFWFFGHPEVYIIVLPGLTLVSLILPKFAGRKVFGFRYMVYTTLAIGVLSFGVWAHHMFATGIDPRLRMSFMIVSVAIAVPSAIKTFSWIATLWNGRIRFTAPMLFCIGGVSTFIIGGITGVFLASIPVDLLMHDTWYVVGHFHFIIMGLIIFAMFAGSYYWFPIFTGKMYDRRLALIHIGLTFIGVWLAFTAMLLLGYAGLPRRYATYPPKFILLQQIATVGAYMISAGTFVWLWNLMQSYRKGQRITDADVWNLKETGQFTREWQWFENRLEEKRGDDR